MISQGVVEQTPFAPGYKRASTAPSGRLLGTNTENLLRMDIATRVIDEELSPEQTIILKVMTRNPIFVNSDSLAIDALQKMVQGKTYPYVIFRLGDQVIRSKRKSLTTVIGPPGEPIWNQDFNMLVTNPRKEKLSIEVKDTLGISDLTIVTAEGLFLGRTTVIRSS